MIDTERCVLIVSRDFLLDFPFVAVVRTGSVVGERLRASELVVAGWCSDDVAVACYLAGKAGDWAGDCGW